MFLRTSGCCPVLLGPSRRRSCGETRLSEKLSKKQKRDRPLPCHPTPSLFPTKHVRWRHGRSTAPRSRGALGFCAPVVDTLLRWAAFAQTRTRTRIIRPESRGGECVARLELP